MGDAVPAAVIVLAAGEGTRMRSDTPKVLHRLAGRSMLGHAIHAAQGVSPDRIAVVVRHGRDAVAAHALDTDPSILIADQDAVPGTGRAVSCGLGALDAAHQARHVIVNGVPEDASASTVSGISGAVVVIAGDVPLLDAGTLQALVETHASDANSITVLTTTVADPTGYGRILRDVTGAVVGIVEERDATDEQRAIDEINSSIYVFDAQLLRSALGEVATHNDQGEVYLTDVLAIAHNRGLRVRAVRTDDPLVVEGVNDRVQLARLGRELNDRILERWMRDGVTIVDPFSTWVDVDVDLGRDVTLLPGVQLLGATSVADGATVGPDTTLTDVEVGAGASVARTHGSLAVIGAGATVGPYTYLRPGTELGADGKIGAFVEVKNAKIGTGTKVPHLSYVGDATIGDRTNIGAGTIFVNYDGVKKHHTTVGDAARTGANNIFIAPVSIGDGAYTGGGTVVRFDVPAGALAVSAGNQRIIEGWTERRRAGTEPADRAGAARSAAAPRGTGLSSQARAEQERAGGTAPTPIPSEPGGGPTAAVPTSSTTAAPPPPAPSEGSTD